MDLAEGIQWYLTFLFSTCFHEAAHAWAALRLGDDTAHRGGQVTLDPVPHIRREPMGMVAVPILSYFLGGWMIGWASAPFSPKWALRHPRRAGVMALAGPSANILLMFIAVLLMRIGCEWGVFRTLERGGFRTVIVATGSRDGIAAFFAQMLSLLFSLNLLLGAFNLLPVPPLDGSNVPLLLLAQKTARRYWIVSRRPVFALVGLVVAWKITGVAFPSLFDSILKLLDNILAA